MWIYFLEEFGSNLNLIAITHEGSNSETNLKLLSVEKIKGSNVHLFFGWIIIPIHMNYLCNVWIYFGIPEHTHHKLPLLWVYTTKSFSWSFLCSTIQQNLKPNRTCNFFYLFHANHDTWVIAKISISTPEFCFCPIVFHCSN